MIDRRLSFLPVWVLVLALTGGAFANPIVTILKTDGTSGPLTVGVNTPFDVSIYIYTDVSLTAAQFYFTETTSLGYLTVNSVTWNNNSVWDTSFVLPNPGGGAGPYTPQESPDVPPSGFQLDAGQSYQMDMYRFATNLVTGTGTSPGSPGWKWATLNLTASASGTFNLQATGLVFSDVNFDPVSGSTGAVFQIQSGSGGGQGVPAPGAAILAFLGMNIVGYLKRPRRKDLAPAAA